MSNKHLKKLVLTAMLLAVGYVLPLLTGQIREIGNMLLPMHIPVMLCGLICGEKYGAVLGAVLPLSRSIFFTMPVLYPNAVAMAFELASYGFVVGLVYRLFTKKNTLSVILSLLAAMLIGRVIWGGVQSLLLGVFGSGYSLAMFVSGAFLNAFPGMILQLILIPAIMAALRRAHLLDSLR
ncbi:MAG: ECF transporter S component [Ruminococcaceae bacterium]|nr:ECF transporter S component [Oscillospiraceae bacterium]